MKNLLKMACAIVLLISSTAYAQSEVPETVSENFKAQYTTNTDATWKQSSPDTYQVSFVTPEGNHEAQYSANGDWLQTKSSTDPGALPDAVLETLASNFGSYGVFSASKYTSPNAKGYAVMLKDASELVEVILDTEGNVLKPTALEEGR